MIRVKEFPIEIVYYASVNVLMYILRGDKKIYGTIHKSREPEFHYFKSNTLQIEIPVLSTLSEEEYFLMSTSTDLNLELCESFQEYVLSTYNEYNNSKETCTILNQIKLRY